MTESKHPTMNPLPDPVPAAPPTVDLQAEPTLATEPEPTPEPEARSTPSVPDIPPPPSTPAPVPRRPRPAPAPVPRQQRPAPEPEAEAELEPWSEPVTDLEPAPAPKVTRPSSPQDTAFAEQVFTDIRGNVKRLRDIPEAELAGGFWPREAYEAWKTWRRHVEGV